MRFSEDGMAAPAAIVRTASRRDDRYRACVMMKSPGFKIAFNGNRFPAGPGLFVDIRDLHARRSAANLSVLCAKRDAAHMIEPFQRPALEDRKQFLESDLSFAYHDDVCARF